MYVEYSRSLSTGVRCSSDFRVFFLAHEANVEQIFSRAGNLSDPNMDPEFLAQLVMIAVNKKAFLPSLTQIKSKYFAMYRGKGGEDGEDDEDGDGAAAGPSGTSPAVA